MEDLNLKYGNFIAANAAFSRAILTGEKLQKLSILDSDVKDRRYYSAF